MEIKLIPFNNGWQNICALNFDIEWAYKNSGGKMKLTYDEVHKAIRAAFYGAMTKTLIESNWCSVEGIDVDSTIGEYTRIGMNFYLSWFDKNIEKNEDFYKQWRTDTSTDKLIETMTGLIDSLWIFELGWPYALAGGIPKDRKDRLEVEKEKLRGTLEKLKTTEDFYNLEIDIFSTYFDSVFDLQIDINDNEKEILWKE